MGSLGPTELIIIGLIVILLFGAKKLPDTARALGQSLRLFKKETQKLREDDDDKATVVQAETVTPQPAPAPPAQIPPATPTPSVEDRLRQLEEENAKLRATSQPAAQPSDKKN
ncbi:twin-arginine translocase TatA/TatE family subunit [Herbidospora sp. NEAU-GS84]|uniref:Sec-independent protein translocase protein TatA n=1 Tax=Herbidospora solisilvae TaxID=2696284 RepID=A0A7C9N533_9ACTN|nr:Sec-independent protein translocase subunit TatA [Herbidospora solisilvae]NAS26229.1 twin-arginine translocase TatA/TatE family subunit [Herbidospora solisilvae]